MSSIDFSEYSELVDEGTGFSTKTPVAPEDEFFHAVYISGQQRKNHLGETEIPGKLQIRGLKGNLDEIDMVITHVKQVLVKTTRVNNRDNLECFCYQQGPPPWKGISGQMCGKNATERASIPYCSPCRSQLIVSGIYVDQSTGKPFLVDGQPVYIFIRAKGIKYGAVANFLSDMAKRDDLEPIVTPVTEQSKKFERDNVNHKRFIVKVRVGKQSSAYGMKDIFEFQTSTPLSVESVKSILNRSKETLEKFKEKFDWSRNKGSDSSDYSGSSASKPTEDQTFDFESKGSSKQEPPKQETKKVDNFSFEDVTF
jgi:hypothetical protein